MFAAVRAQNLDLHSVLVIRNSYLVLEAYFDPYEAGDAHTIELNTKSVVAMLVGIAIDQGKIVSVDQKLLDFQPGAEVANLSMSGVPDLTIGLDNRYRPNIDPDSDARTIGLRGRWLADGNFRVEDITLGEFNKSEVLVEFKGDGLMLTVTSLSFPGEPLVIRGRRKP